MLALKILIMCIHKVVLKLWLTNNFYETNTCWNPKSVKLTDPDEKDIITWYRVNPYLSKILRHASFSSLKSRYSINAQTS